ncbi:MAG: DUF6920 family protein, partial [Bacteroidota bacterium]
DMTTSHSGIPLGRAPTDESRGTTQTQPSDHNSKPRHDIDIMRRVLKPFLLLAGATAMTTLVTATLVGIRWQRATSREIARLPHAASPAESQPLSIPKDLPTPVKRYFSFALPDDLRQIHRTRIDWSGTFRARPDGDWSPFTAVQHFSANPPGFVWDATIRMLPVVPVRVRDAYMDGEAVMDGRIGGLIRIVNEGGTPEIAASALVRWIGEAMWFPTALLPREGLRWTSVDDKTARLTVADRSIEVSADFHFDTSGAITGMTAMRYRDVDGQGVLTPFEGRYNRYERRGDFMIPAEAEVAWLLPEGRYAYWRGHVDDIVYEMSPVR